MSFPESNTPIDLRGNLVDLKTYRANEALIVLVAYAQDHKIYQNSRIIDVDKTIYAATPPNDLVNKFGLTYTPESTLLLHKKLADVLIDTALDMHMRYGQFIVVMDALRTYESAYAMGKRRPDLVALKLLAPAGASAHNRALAVDSKLFEKIGGELVEADEHGHLDDLDMAASNRFYNGAMSEIARKNRLNRLQAWQRASVKNAVPVANLFAEFWDDRVPGSPADLWRVLSCRALCIGMDGNPKTNPAIAYLKNELDTLYDEQEKRFTTRQQFAKKAYARLCAAWDEIFTAAQKQKLEQILGNGGANPPALADFIFHEWLETIHDRNLVNAGFPAQSITHP